MTGDSVKRIFESPSVEVIDVQPSAYFPGADVLILKCQHRHVRPKGWRKVGDTLPCVFCYDAKPVPQLVTKCSKCATPKRDPEHEHPGICVCGGFLTDEPAMV